MYATSRNVGHQLFRSVAELDPDVVLMEIRMSVMDGVAATRKLTRLGARARVLILTTYDAGRFVYEALRAGAGGSY